jgi:hypothetical protein
MNPALIFLLIAVRERTGKGCNMVAKDPARKLAKAMDTLRNGRCAVELDIDELRELLRGKQHGKVVLIESDIIMIPKPKRNGR